jgi:L-lactate dehydrogenase
VAVVSKVAVVGAGAVGTAIAYAAQIRGVCRELALFDLNPRKVRAEVLDLNHGMQFTPMARITGSDDLEVCAGADVVVITAGAKQDPGQTRLDLAAANVAMCRDLVPALVSLAPDALLLVVTNPVDVVTYAAQEFSGLPPHRVFGSGTVLDSSRLRFLIAEHTRVAVQNVHAYIVGEHGDTEFPLWSKATIGTVPILEWEADGHPRMTADELDAIAVDVRDAAYKVIQGKGATNYAIGLSSARIVEAILGDEHAVMPVSTVLHDYHGITGVALSVPSVVSASGAKPIRETPYSASELGLLRRSADALREVAASLR